jgi:hypothetical protein
LPIFLYITKKEKKKKEKKNLVLTHNFKLLIAQTWHANVRKYFSLFIMQNDKKTFFLKNPFCTKKTKFSKFFSNVFVDSENLP